MCLCKAVAPLTLYCLCVSARLLRPSPGASSAVCSGVSSGICLLRCLFAVAFVFLGFDFFVFLPAAPSVSVSADLTESLPALETAATEGPLMALLLPLQPPAAAAAAGSPAAAADDAAATAEEPLLLPEGTVAARLPPTGLVLLSGLPSGVYRVAVIHAKSKRGSNIPMRGSKVRPGCCCCCCGCLALSLLTVSSACLRLCPSNCVSSLFVSPCVSLSTSVCVVLASLSVSVSLIVLLPPVSLCPSLRLSACACAHSAVSAAAAAVAAGVGVRCVSFSSHSPPSVSPGAVSFSRSSCSSLRSQRASAAAAALRRRQQHAAGSPYCSDSCMHLLRRQSQTRSARC